MSTTVGLGEFSAEDVDLVAAIETLPWLLPAGTTHMPLWVNPTSRAQFESALDKGMLYVAVSNGAWWLCRRNGKTKTWKTRPAEWRIPIKYGFQGMGYLWPLSQPNSFRIASSRDNAEARHGLHRKVGL
jgi:hypothetical protein